MYYFSSKEKKQRIDRLSDMLSFVCFFLFNQSKKNAVFEPRVGHFQGLVGFEAKAKTKDLKMCPPAKDVLEDFSSGFDCPEI